MSTQKTRSQYDNSFYLLFARLVTNIKSVIDECYSNIFHSEEVFVDQVHIYIV